LAGGESSTPALSRHVDLVAIVATEAETRAAVPAAALVGAAAGLAARLAAGRLARNADRDTPGRLIRDFPHHANLIRFGALFRNAFAAGHLALNFPQFFLVAADLDRHRMAFADPLVASHGDFFPCRARHPAANGFHRLAARLAAGVAAGVAAVA